MLTTEAVQQEFRHEADATRRLLAAIPDAHLAWRPHPKSRTLGQLGLHVASIPEVVNGMMTAASVEARSDSPSPTTQSAITDAFEHGAAALEQTLNALMPSDLSAAVTFTAGGRVLFNMPRGAILRTILLNHAYHHRGQLSVYLRLLNVPVPMVYGPTADVNPFGQ